MVISQYDLRMYQDEIAELRQEMTQLLISMELYHQTHSLEEFNRWWSGEGHEREYFSCQRRLEQVTNLLSVAQVQEQAHPKMRRGGHAPAGYAGAEEKEQQ